MLNIKIILGSTRPQRFGIQPAEWITSLAKSTKDVKFELIDLKEVNLPMFDEPVPPLMHQYTNEHTKKWAKMVEETDGFIFVTPEYNHSFPAALKNAIDYASIEWRYKPVGFVSYGAAAGGARAVEQLRGVVAVLRMYSLGEAVAISNYWTQLDADGKFQPTPEQTKAAQELLKEVTFWSEQMKDARQKQAKLA